MVAIYLILYWTLRIFSLILIARVLLSYFPNQVDHNSQWVQMLYKITEPVLQPIRNALPPTSGMDFSPLVAFLGIFVLQVMLRGIFF